MTRESRDFVSRIGHQSSESIEALNLQVSLAYNLRLALFFWYDLLPGDRRIVNFAFAWDIQL